jgi:transcriptional regulator with XRE-family HTH domain
MTVSDIVAARVRKVRKQRDWSPADLAARCAELGADHLTENVIENIESRSARASKRPRPVTVDELLTLGPALNVYPVHLLVPPDDYEEPYPVTTTVTEPNYRVRGWIRGLFPLPRFPRVGDERDLWAQVPPDEFEAMQQGQCIACGGRPPQQITIRGKS